MKEKLFLLLVVIGLAFPYPVISLLLNHKFILAIAGTLTAISFGKEIINDVLDEI